MDDPQRDIDPEIYYEGGCLESLILLLLAIGFLAIVVCMVWRWYWQ
jgi:hypothetical protein